MTTESGKSPERPNRPEPAGTGDTGKQQSSGSSPLRRSTPDTPLSPAKPNDKEGSTPESPKLPPEDLDMWVEECSQKWPVPESLAATLEGGIIEQYRHGEIDRDEASRRWQSLADGTVESRSPDEPACGHADLRSPSGVGPAVGPPEPEDAGRGKRFPLKITNKAAEPSVPQKVVEDAPGSQTASRPEPAAELQKPAKDGQAETSAETSEVDESTLKGLLIEPSKAELKPGETVSFLVKAETDQDALVKVANAEWTAQGGEVDKKGVYVAGTAAGKYAVTAKAGSLSAAAQVTIAVPKPTWKVLEPEDQSDPVPHETHNMWMRDKEWKIVAASVRGKLHAHKALWREDAYAVDWVDDWTIIAVGDGAGSAVLSRIGSRVACDAAVASLKGLLEDFAISRRGDDVPKDKDLQKLKSFLVMAASEARNEVVREAHDRKCNLKDLSTTLLVAVHVPWKKKHLVASVQVGDGAIGVYEKGGACTVLGVADHGEFSSETVFLTSGSELVKKPLDQRVLFTLKPNVQCVGVMCDGVADDFFPEEKRLVQLFNGDPIEELQTVDGGPVQGVMPAVIPTPRDGAALQDWLKYEKKGSSDDRTLVLLYRR